MLGGILSLQLLTLHPTTHQLSVTSLSPRVFFDSKNISVPPSHSLLTLHQDSTVICLSSKCIYHLCLIWLLYACRVYQNHIYGRYVYTYTSLPAPTLISNMLSVLRELIIWLLLLSIWFLCFSKCFHSQKRCACVNSAGSLHLLLGKRVHTLTWLPRLYLSSTLPHNWDFPT